MVLTVREAIDTWTKALEKNPESDLSREIRAKADEIAEVNRDLRDKFDEIWYVGLRHVPALGSQS